jgi:dTDP-4-dehydrorhamnose 3,5-epimerase-like enzyme
MMKRDDCRVINLPRNADERGALTVVEAQRHVPFEIRRVFYLYEVPPGMRRAGHALRRCHQFIIAAAGSFDVVVDTGRTRERYHLDRLDRGLYVPPMVWRELESFSAGSVCLVLASEYYALEDYVDEYAQYRRAVEEATE